METNIHWKGIVKSIKKRAAELIKGLKYFPTRVTKAVKDFPTTGGMITSYERYKNKQAAITESKNLPKTKAIAKSKGFNDFCRDITGIPSMWINAGGREKDLPDFVVKANTFVGFILDPWLRGENLPEHNQQDYKSALKDVGLENFDNKSRTEQRSMIIGKLHEYGEEISAFKIANDKSNIIPTIGAYFLDLSDKLKRINQLEINNPSHSTKNPRNNS